MKIASHAEDIDGIISAALLLKVFPQARVKFLTVLQARKTKEHFDIVADLYKPINARIAIDHHLTNLELLKREKRLSEEDLIDPNAPSAASLVAKKFHLDDEVSKKLVGIANKADTGNLEGDLIYLDKLIKLNAKNQWYLEKLARKLSVVGLDFEKDPWIRDEIGKIRLDIESKIKKIMEIIQDIVSRELKFFIFDARNVPFYVAKDFASLFVKHGGYVGISIYFDFTGALRCSIRISSDFNKLSAADIASKARGGGHEKAAGCNINNLGDVVLVILEELSRYGIVGYAEVSV